MALPEAAGNAEADDPSAAAPLSGDNGPAEAKDKANKLLDFPKGLDEAKVIAVCKEREAGFLDYWNQKRMELEEYEDLFNCKPVHKQTTPKTAPTLPVPNSQVETTIANLMRALYSKPRIVEARPRTAEMDDQGRLLVNDFLNQEILFGPQHRPILRDGLFNASLRGLTIFKSVWREDEHVQLSVRNLAPQGSGLTILDPVRDVLARKRGRWTFESHPLYDILWDTRERHFIQHSEFVRHNLDRTPAQLMQMQQDGLIQGVDDILKQDVTNNQEERTADRNRNPSAKTWLLKEWWGLMHWETVGEDGSPKVNFINAHWFVCADKVLAFRENPLVPQRHPYISGHYQPGTDGLIGNSAMTPTSSLAKHVGDQLGKKKKAVDDVVNAPTYYEPLASGLEPSRMKTGQGGFIPVADASKINKPPVDASSLTALREDIQSNIGMMQEATPANAQFQGSGDNADTATGDTINYTSGSIRFGEVVEAWASEVFPALALECMSMWKQFGDPADLWVGDTSIDGATRLMPFALLNMEYDFIHEGQASQANTQGMLKNKMDLATMLSNMQSQNPNNMVNGQNQVMHFNMIDFLVKEVMPATNVKNGAAYFQMGPVQPPPGAMPAPGQMMNQSAQGTPSIPHPTPAPPQIGPGPGGPGPIQAPGFGPHLPQV